MSVENLFHLVCRRREEGETNAGSIRSFFNLVVNAIKFTEAGEVWIEVETTGDFVHIFRRDTGPGVDESDSSKDFQEFQQVIIRHQDEGGARDGAWRIVKERCGDAWGTEFGLESRIGHGATFSFWCRPARQKSDAGHEQARMVVEVRRIFKIGRFCAICLQAQVIEMIEENDADDRSTNSRRVKPKARTASDGYSNCLSRRIRGGHGYFI